MSKHINLDVLSQIHVTTYNGTIQNNNYKIYGLSR